MIAKDFPTDGFKLVTQIHRQQEAALFEKALLQY